MCSENVQEKKGFGVKFRKDHFCHFLDYSCTVFTESLGLKSLSRNFR